LPESERSIRGDEATDPRIETNAARVLPLPKGEGWGEGKERREDVGRLLGVMNSLVFA
jgi:hypothetical protein